MKVKMRANLGHDWPEPWKDGETHDAPEALAQRLIAKNLAVLIEEPGSEPFKLNLRDDAPAILKALSEPILDLPAEAIAPIAATKEEEEAKLLAELEAEQSAAIAEVVEAPTAEQPPKETKPKRKREGK